MIDLQGVSCRLADGRTLFDDVSMSLLSTATVGIVGPNGAGKSTFLKLLAGRGQDKLTEGAVRVKDGARVTYLAQEPELDEAKDVRGNVALGGGAAAGLLSRFEEINAALSGEGRPSRHARGQRTEALSPSSELSRGKGGIGFCGRMEGAYGGGRSWFCCASC